MNYKIYNKSSEDMSEIKTNSIDLIYFSPPYNINTNYDTFNDNLDLNIYIRLIKNVLKECFRVSSLQGRLIIELADTVFTNGKYIQFAGMIQSIVLSQGYYLESRHINFVNTNNCIEMPDHGFDENYITTKSSHSNSHQILVFNKKKVHHINGDIFYFNYKNDHNHPCSCPKPIIDFIIDKYFKIGYSVLDPFMGTANFGVEVLNNGGKFYGYELVEKYFNIANNKLKIVIK